LTKLGGIALDKKKGSRLIRPIRAKKRGRLLYKAPERDPFGDPDDWKEWKDTVYYQWWDYLRAHDGYKETCEAGGKGEFADLYKDFGDIHTMCFPTWWKSKGRALFAEPFEGAFAMNMNARIQKQLRERVNPDYPVWSTIFVPLHIPAKILADIIAEFIETEQKKHKIDIERLQSRAKYRLYRSTMRRAAIERALKVWRLRKEHPDLEHWEIGLKAGHIPPGRLDSNNKPDADQRLDLGQKVARDLRDAEQRLQFVGQGDFPRKK